VTHQRHHSQAEISRILVAADAGVDPHRLVTLCCQRPDSEMLSVSLLVPLADDSNGPLQVGARRASLLRRASALLDAAGVRLEDFVLAGGDADEVDDLLGSGEFDAVLICAANEEMSSRVLALVAELARMRGLAIVESGRMRRDHRGWLRRVVNPLMGW
jgi:hypothetical protein